MSHGIVGFNSTTSAAPADDRGRHPDLYMFPAATWERPCCHGRPMRFGHRRLYLRKVLGALRKARSDRDR